MKNDHAVSNYWSKPIDVMLELLSSNRQGLDKATAAERLRQNGRNTFIADHRRSKAIQLFLNQFRSPLVLILIFAAIVALIVHDWLDASIVLGIVLITAVLSFIQEYRATHAVEKLRQQISIKSTVLRDGQSLLIPSDEIVPGDIVLLSAGNLIPADGILLEAKDFYVSQAILTGETYPVEKSPGISPENASLVDCNNCVFMGTSVRSGVATALIVHTGRETNYGHIAETLALRPPETEFERGLRHFGALLVRIMVVMVIAVLAINIVLQHPTIETVLFALALAVALSPELLPAILTITLAHGAKKMASHGVIVKRLNAIENLGSMDVLCADKTGTLTKGVVQLDKALDTSGHPCEAVLHLAYLNSQLQTGLANPLDEAIIVAGKQSGMAFSAYHKLDEVPYDFVRRRLSIVVRHEQKATALMICKGALQNVLEVCDQIQTTTTIEPLTDEHYRIILQRFTEWSTQGYRVLGIAQKSVMPDRGYTRNDEQAMVFVGFLLFFDPPEENISKTLHALRRLGVQLKIITGDNQYVARHVAETVGIKVQHIITGAELADLNDEALWHLAPHTTLFAEVDPNQKERIITALQKTGHVVGYLGDGINDAPALHAADVGISVDQAADVAKEAADFVLLEHDLQVLCQGIDEGRHTFANTLKYIFITTSANFGNMVSMALASLFLPFLPLLAKQILLNNFLADIPSIGIAGDNVDRDWESTPHRWDIKLIRNFMITFGLVSTVFDLITFSLLLYLVGQMEEIFRTGWFVESLLTELLVLFVIRSHKPFYQSKPGRFLIWSAAIIVALTLVLPYLTIGTLFDFVPLPGPVLGAILAITGLYVVVTEYIKYLFFRRFSKRYR
ncbi:magnesium-translocating P-type ATPase [Nitrosomonas sp. Is37]|uniref:magnesium-translocating P-type ATPase n=1 Tax=Nitrosomonas sp. Is37 TaxID=3080535 RepID=UPI00294B286E|nr:magnesium-translocating P-type ATPase [Nitrosomonas sp. Is37]MDV6345078.1 magnesium-translocating P-type ATPase [Nitrosomonas sp. Is37]